MVRERRPADQNLLRRASTRSQFDLMAAAAKWLDENGADTMGTKGEELPDALQEVVQRIGNQWTNTAEGPH